MRTDITKETITKNDYHALMTQLNAKSDNSGRFYWETWHMDWMIQKQVFVKLAAAGVVKHEKDDSIWYYNQAEAKYVKLTDKPHTVYQDLCYLATYLKNITIH